MQKYRNHKYNFLLKNPPSLLPLKVSPTLLLQSTRSTGYTKFVRAHSDEVTKVVNEEREANDISFHEGPVMFQKRMGFLWQALEQSQRDHWDNMPESIEDKQDLANIYA